MLLISMQLNRLWGNNYKYQSLGEGELPPLHSPLIKGRLTWDKVEQFGVYENAF